jgi:hypothetical protein
MKNSWIENPNGKNMLWYFEVLPMGKFWQFWAIFAALAMAESMPKLELKS